MRGAHRAQQLEPLGIGAGGDHGGAKLRTELHCGRAHAASSAMHQQRLTGLKRAPRHQRHIAGRRTHRHAGGTGKIPTLRNRIELGSRHDVALGKRAGQIRETHRVAHAPGLNARPDRLDHTRAFHAHHIRQIGFVLIAAAGHQQVREIERGRAHPDRDLARPRRARIELDEMQPRQVAAQGIATQCAVSGCRGAHGRLLPSGLYCWSVRRQPKIAVV